MAAQPSPQSNTVDTAINVSSSTGSPPAHTSVAAVEPKIYTMAYTDADDNSFTWSFTREQVDQYRIDITQGDIDDSSEQGRRNLSRKVASWIFAADIGLTKESIVNGDAQQRLQSWFNAFNSLSFIQTWNKDNAAAEKQKQNITTTAYALIFYFLTRWSYIL